jgi:hypothetical protein
LVFAIHMTWFEGELVLYPVYYILCFTCYNSLYLLNYAYHCAKMSSNEI